MKIQRPLAIVLVFLGVLLWIGTTAADAGRVGSPYRGPKELLAAGQKSDESEEPDSAEPTEPSEDDTETDPNAPDEPDTPANPAEGDDGQGPDGSGPAPPDKGTGSKTSALDGVILWEWWWEHNKDRYLARLTSPGRIQPGSIYFWMGHGAKYPPREIVPVSDVQRDKAIFPALRRNLHDQSRAVRAEACIALGRLGNVPAAKDQVSDSESNNLVVRELIGVLRSETGQTPDSREVRVSAILGIGMSGDEYGCQFLMRNLAVLQKDERAFAYIAFGLARHTPALEMLVESLPDSGKRKANNLQIAAIHALGLYGPDAVEEINSDDRAGIEALEKLVDPRGYEPLVMQSVAALARLQQSPKVVQKAFRSKSPDIQWTSLLASPNFSEVEKDAKIAATLLMKEGYRAGPGQHKNFSILALGELAGRLDPNSKTRAQILKFLQERVQERKSNYIRACASVALGLADDRTAIPLVAEILDDTTTDHYAKAAACLGLGLLRATDHANLILKGVLGTKWNAEARGYGLLGLALMGDTTRVRELLKFTARTNRREIDRQLPLAIGILGDRRTVRTLARFFSRAWKAQRRHAVANAAFAFAWNRDQSALASLVKMATRDPNAQVRGMATIALGYLSARERINPLTRCYENISYRSRF
ncbi:MAG: HEAT repeat domain-containing protein, partial [Planctomycetota bacterium]